MAKPALITPAIAALKGWEDAITIIRVTNGIEITAELPVLTGAGLVGSDKLVIGEITPSMLQANAWVDGSIQSNAPLGNDNQLDTLEQYFYKHAIECDHVITDIIRIVNGLPISCKRITVRVYPNSDFDLESSKPQVMSVDYGIVELI